MNDSSLVMPEVALDLLLMENQKNRYLINGHNFQDTDLRIYLPGNGALLTAVALLCKQGFPDNGKWNVNFEKIHFLYE